jgi:hypothetical protein
MDYCIKGKDANIEYKVVQVFTNWDEYYYVITYIARYHRQ